MAIWRRLESWLSRFPWYRRQERDADLARELRDHLDLEADERRAAGLSPEEAAYAAHRALGNTLKIEEDVRAARGFQWFETLIQDVRFGLRMLRKSPGFTAVAVLTLALGIGGITAMFSAFDAVLVRPLPYADAGRLVMIWDDMGKADATTTPTPAEWIEWRRLNSVFTDPATSQPAEATLSGDGEPEQVPARKVTWT